MPRVTNKFVQKNDLSRSKNRLNSFDISTTSRQNGQLLSSSMPFSACLPYCCLLDVACIVTLEKRKKYIWTATDFVSIFSVSLYYKRIRLNSLLFSL